MKYLYALMVLLSALIIAGFISQNSQPLVLKYFFWQTIPLPLSLYMILSFVAGYAVAVLVGFSSGIRFRFRASAAEKEARRLRAELEQLKKEEAKTAAQNAQIESGEDTGSGDEPTRILSDDAPEADDATVITDTAGEEEKK
jgi:uncharacterized integral membrane protein